MSLRQEAKALLLLVILYLFVPLYISEVAVFYCHQLDLCFSKKNFMPIISQLYGIGFTKIIANILIAETVVVMSFQKKLY
ncbi:hypothetical protein ATZ36_16985 [Candidatus Endomicrobiellum trichonymphae]|uniref:Uncharacterized protein n=1 Tax=Endomicrobium trichonymphae TaxID=1408204 RepID=A0A1E5IKJ5_ENDTX|nr:hypothetical protein ATZ36_16985 [Candidatus Endomicrobium trichonymphae]